MTIPSTAVSSAWFLNGVDDLQRRQTETQRQISSGYRVQDAADSPTQVSELVSLTSSLSAFKTWSNNLERVQAETQTADQAIGSASSLLDQARALGVSGGATAATASDRQALAAQVQSLQQQFVSLANTAVEGRYIFAGDQDQSAPYQFTGIGPTGVSETAPSISTRTIENPTGDVVYGSLTARQLFDGVDSTGAPAATNAFAALQSLATALGTNDEPGIANALTALRTASDWVNQQQAYYGTAENRISAEQAAAASQITRLQTRIGEIRDTDVVQAATQLAQENLAQSAAYGAQAQIGRKSLFDYLG